MKNMVLRIMRKMAQAGVILLLGLSLFSLVTAGLQIANDPLASRLIERSAAEFAAKIESELARFATPDELHKQISEELTQEPRNWIVITSLEELASARSIPLSPELSAARQEAYDDDYSYLNQIKTCASCMVDTESCTLSQALICNAPISFTPIGDVIGLGKAGVAGVTGGEIDQIDLALSAIGLTATAAVVVTGGTSYSVKIGASILKTARKMSLLPPKLIGLITDTARKAVDPALLSFSDPIKAVNVDALAPLSKIAGDLTRVSGKLSNAETLHLLRYIDGPQEARAIANATEAIGSKVVGTVKVLGKSRFMRAALRYSDEFIAVVGGLIGLFTSFILLLTGIFKSFALSRLRAYLRRRARKNPA